MISEVFVEGKRVRLHPSRALGKGGEADVYEIGGGRALKVFKSPDHPDYLGLPLEQQAAEERIAMQQRKLRAFPAGLPGEVVAPLALATDRSGRLVVGYTMALVPGAEPLRRYADPVFRRAGVSAGAVVGLFGDLLQAVRAIHAANVVIADFNDMNVLVTSDQSPHLIDADSFQYASFPCGVFTEAFVDPLLCSPSASAPVLVRPYVAESDWYAYSALLLQSLLFVGPYGGIYRPREPSARIPHRQRPLERVTVFHPEVLYPKPAIPFSVLPDDLLQHFHRVFELDERGPFPQALLDGLRFTRCAQCHTEHARTLCPVCFANAVRTPKAAAVLPGQLRTESLFRTRGVIVHAAIGGGEVRFVYHDEGAFRREDGTPVLLGKLGPGVRIRVRGGRTLVGSGGGVSVLSGPTVIARLAVDGDGSGPAFEANDRHHYWVQDGHLWRDTESAWDPAARELIGDVLSNQTRLYVGPAFGLGFYRAGSLSRAFLFDAERRGLNDELRLPPLPGELIESTAVLDDSRAWLFLAVRHAGRVRHMCFVYSRTGQLEASSEADPGDGGWLSTLRGKCAVGGVLFAPTDAGIVRVEVEDGAVEETRRFPETAELVDESSQLLAGRRGLCVVRTHDIVALQLTPK